SRVSGLRRGPRVGVGDALAGGPCGEGCPMRPGGQTRWWSFVWVLVFGTLGSVWCVAAGARLGPTYDEPFHLEEGLRFWHTGSLKPLLDKGAMPLPMVVFSAPVRAWEVLRGRPAQFPADLDEALRLARAATLLFWWLLLVYGYLAGARI